MKTLKSVLFENIEGFDFFDVDFENETEVKPNSKEYEDFIGLDSGDKFMVGKKKPIFRVFGKPGSMVGGVTKDVVVDGTAGRKFYQARLEDLETGVVGVYEYLKGGATTSKVPFKGLIAPITRVK